MTPLPPSQQSNGVWEGMGLADERWRLEIETDRFDEELPFAVSIWAEDENPEDGKAQTLVQASAAQAREMAARLLHEADNVDANNARVAAWTGKRESDG